MNTIKFIFEDNTIEPLTLTGDFENKSILEIAEENDVHLSHNCGGVCACSTCHVYVLHGDESLTEISDCEEDQIDGAINPTLESRLGCQAEIEDKNATIEVKIPNQDQIISHEH